MTDAARETGKRLQSIDPEFRISRLASYLGPQQYLPCNRPTLAIVRLWIRISIGRQRPLIAATKNGDPLTGFLGKCRNIGVSQFVNRRYDHRWKALQTCRSIPPSAGVRRRHRRGRFQAREPYGLYVPPQ